MAEDAGFEPARACTQPAFQFWDPGFWSVRQPSLSVTPTVLDTTGRL